MKKCAKFYDFAEPLQHVVILEKKAKTTTTTRLYTLAKLLGPTLLAAILNFTLISLKLTLDPSIMEVRQVHL